jgi:hypothetical protein
VFEYSGDGGKPDKICRYDSKGDPQETVINEYALVSGGTGGIEKSGEVL